MANDNKKRPSGLEHLTDEEYAKYQQEEKTRVPETSGFDGRDRVAAAKAWLTNDHTRAVSQRPSPVGGNPARPMSFNPADYPAAKTSLMKTVVKKEPELRMRRELKKRMVRINPILDTNWAAPKPTAMAEKKEEEKGLAGRPTRQNRGNGK